jgi:hypothetical protein
MGVGCRSTNDTARRHSLKPTRGIKATGNCRTGLCHYAACRNGRRPAAGRTDQAGRLDQEKLPHRAAGTLGGAATRRLSRMADSDRRNTNRDRRLSIGRRVTGNVETRSPDVREPDNWGTSCRSAPPRSLRPLTTNPVSDRVPIVGSPRGPSAR